LAFGGVKSAPILGFSQRRSARDCLLTLVQWALHLWCRHFTRNWAKERANEALMEATSSPASVSLSRASARRRASSALLATLAKMIKTMATNPTEDNRIGDEAAPVFDFDVVQRQAVSRLRAKHGAAGNAVTNHNHRWNAAFINQYE
jgi:hypothetical protein